MKANNYVGTFVYVLIFMILIPVVLYTFGATSIMEVYLPNVDMIASTLTVASGASGLFSNVYSTQTDTFFQFAIQSVINYAALIGATYLIARETYHSKSIAAGWSIAFVMMITTYLLPGKFIEFTNSIVTKHAKSQWVQLATALSVVTFFIGLERLLLALTRDVLMHIATMLAY